MHQSPSAPILRDEGREMSSSTVILIETLSGTTAWYVTVLVSEILAFLLIALGLGLLTNLSVLLRVGLAVAYFLLLITTCFLSMFTRDCAREQRMKSSNLMVNTTLRLGLSAAFFALAIVIFVLVIAIPTEYGEVFERVGLSSYALLLVLCTFLVTKTVQDRKEATFWTEQSKIPQRRQV